MSQNINKAFQEHTKKFLIEMSCFREAFSTIYTIKFLNSKKYDVSGSAVPKMSYDCSLVWELLSCAYFAKSQCHVIHNRHRYMTKFTGEDLETIRIVLRKFGTAQLNFVH